MSTDFIALFDVTRDDVGPEWLLARVVERQGVFAPFVERYGRNFRSQDWSIETGDAAGGKPAVTGPGGYSLECKGRTLELWHGMRFGMFTGDEWHRGSLRRVCSVVANLVRSERAIYTHELMPYGGADGLAEIESVLRARIGPPATTFEELHAAEYFGPRAWYIDTFVDLRRAGAAGGAAEQDAADQGC